MAAIGERSILTYLGMISRYKSYAVQIAKKLDDLLDVRGTHAIAGNLGV
jgi:hypothetical protein